VIRLEFLNDSNRADVLGIDRSDISEDWVDSISDILELHQYGLEHRCDGHTWAIYADDQCVGIILMGEGFPWPCDPPEVAGIPFYRIMGFVLDKHWRNRGIGSQVLEMVIRMIFAEYGAAPHPDRRAGEQPPYSSFLSSTWFCPYQQLGRRRPLLHPQSVMLHRRTTGGFCLQFITKLHERPFFHLP